MLKSLRLRLLLIFLCLAIAPLVVVGLIVGRRSFAALEQQSVAIQREITARVATEAQALIEGCARELLLLEKVLRLGILEHVEQRALLDGMLRFRPVYQELVLLDATGQEKTRLSRTESFVESELQSRARNDEYLYPTLRFETYFGPVRFDGTIQEPLVTVSIPLYDVAHREIVSVLIAELRFNTIWHLLADRELPIDGDVYVTDQTGKIVAHKKPAVVLSGTMVILPEAEGRASGLTGSDVITVRDSLQLSNQKMIIVSEQPVAAAHGLALDSARILIIALSGALCLAVLLAAVSMYTIVRPIEILAAQAKSIGGGDYSNIAVEGRGSASWPFRLFRPSRDIVRRQDEIGKLALEHNSMADAVRERETALETQNAELKQAAIFLNWKKQGQMDIF